MLCLLVWRNVQNRKRAKTVGKDNDRTTFPEGSQPYLQQKAELEDEERRKHELEARELRYEMDEGNARYELSSTTDQNRMSTRHEMVGPEHSKEMKVPDTL